MLKEQCRVVCVDDKHVWLEFVTATGCAKCDAGQGCGGGIIARLFAPRTVRLKWVNDMDARLDEHLELSIPESLLIKATICAYFIPLLMMIVWPACVVWLYPNTPEWFQVALGATGLAVGVLLSRVLSLRLYHQEQVSLTRPPVVQQFKH